MRGELDRERQRAELVEEELNEMKERYAYLKKQEDIFSLLKGEFRDERSGDRDREREKER